MIIDDGSPTHLPTRPFLHSDARREGVSKHRLLELVRSGSLHQPLRGVLVPRHCQDDVKTRAAAASLVLPPGAAICRRTAAWLLGIDARGPGEHEHPPPIECSVPRGRTPARRPGLRCYVADLTPEDVMEIEGLPCTTEARTAVDLARWSMPGMGLAILDRMARNRLIDPPDLAVLIERWRGHPHVEVARRLIGWCSPLAESYGESWLRLRFLEAGFPTPELQISLTADGIERFRLDLGYRDHRWACEYDGEEHHAGLAAERADRIRRETIEKRWGWTVVGVGKNLVLGRSMQLERAAGEILGMAPGIRRRSW